jgi:hypothetical protein
MFSKTYRYISNLNFVYDIVLPSSGIRTLLYGVDDQLTTNITYIKLHKFGEFFSFI